MLRVGVLVSGGGTNLQAILDAMDQGKITNAEVAAVISNNPGAYALERARNHGIPAECISPKDFPDRASFNEALVAKVDSYDLDLVVLAGFLVKIPEAMIAKYRNKIINIHPSLIPKYCGKGFYGKRVHKAVLEGGEKESGATVHFVDEGVDTGEIILQEKVPVLEGDTPDELAARVLKVEHRILAEGLNQIAAKIQVEKMKSDEKGGQR